MTGQGEEWLVGVDGEIIAILFNGNFKRAPSKLPLAVAEADTLLGAT